MDEKLQELDAKIEKLTQQRKKVKEKSIQSLSMLIGKSKSDLSLLAGMLLDVENIISQNQEKVEAWRDAGKTFLGKGKNNKSDSKGKENTAIHSAV